MKCQNRGRNECGRLKTQVEGVRLCGLKEMAVDGVYIVVHSVPARARRKEMSEVSNAPGCLPLIASTARRADEAWWMSWRFGRWGRRRGGRRGSGRARCEFG